MIAFPSKKEWQFMMWASMRKEGFRKIQLYYQFLPYKFSIDISCDWCIFITLNRTWIGALMEAPYENWKEFCLERGIDPDEDIPF